MGISAERLTGYFFASASKRAASCGEKMLIVSESFPMHQPPRPRLRRHIHLFLVSVFAEPPGFRQFQHAALSILAAPVDLCALPIQLKPRIAMPYRDPLLAKFHGGLSVSVQSVRRGVASQQRSQRDPEFDVELLAGLSHRYRSISPSTISMDPITATTSANSLPLHIVSSACSVANPGYRICTRHGFAVPSDTT